MKQPISSPHPQVPRPLAIALFIALAVGCWLLKGFFALIVTAIIVAFIFQPVYAWLQKKLKRDSLAASCTLLITIFAICIPILLVFAVTVAQANTIIQDASKVVTSQEFTKASSEAITWFNETLTKLSGGNISLSSKEVLSYLSSFASDVASFVVNMLTSWVSSVGGVISGAILYIYIFTGVLVHQKKLTSLLAQLNPLGPTVTKLYLARAGDMTKAMVRGQFIIAALQGTLSAVVLYAVGVPYFAFFLLILTFLSIIPLGAGIVTIPLGVAYMLFGNYWQGAIILLNHFLVITNIDNVLKPKLVPKAVRLHPALLLLSIFAGIGIFGFLGIVIGPVLMILITTTIEIYLSVASRPTPAKSVTA